MGRITNGYHFVERLLKMSLIWYDLDRAGRSFSPRLGQGVSWRGHFYSELHSLILAFHCALTVTLHYNSVNDTYSAYQEVRSKQESDVTFFLSQRDIYKYCYRPLCLSAFLLLYRVSAVCRIFLHSFLSPSPIKDIHIHI